LQELQKTGEILVIQPKDESSRILFFSEQKNVLPVDNGFKQMWSDIIVPDEHELAVQLSKGVEAYWVLLNSNSL